MPKEGTMRKAVDLSAHINQDVRRGHPADFPVVLRPVYYDTGETLEEVPKRLAVVREDTGEALAVVSNRYSLIPHQRLLDLVSEATKHLDVGPVPRGIYVDSKGARMRALFKFPALAQAIHSTGQDQICPCIKIQNTYDTTSRIMVHIGAFRFVCTNLAVGGGGIFAGGFMSVHSGEIPIDKIAEQLGSYLTDFGRIVETYRRWEAEELSWERMGKVLDELPTRAAKRIERRVTDNRVNSVFNAYNAATNHATHQMRSARSAFDLLERINKLFQQHFPPNLN